MTHFRLSNVFDEGREFQVRRLGEIKESHVMDTTKATLHNEALCDSIRTKHQIISEQAVSFGTHPYISLQFLFTFW